MTIASVVRNRLFGRIPSSSAYTALKLVMAP
jgi:hypothetical protein